MTFRPPAPGLIIDNKYRLAERIGGGGMGDVYRAEVLNTTRLVAIKFLHAELTRNVEVSLRFFNEAQAVTKIRHPNIIEVLDTGHSEAGPYLVMEYLEGESVGTALTRLGRFDLESACAATIPVLEALDAAHRAGIVHRDLKPENVFLAQDGRGAPLVKLLDFGIAKVLDTSGPSPRTRTGVVFGTPDYLSPEQATGEAPLDGRSDLFSVGVLLFELVTGARPFRAPTAVATAFRVVHAEAPTVASTGAQVDPRIETIVAKLLQKDPAKRYQMAADVSRDLERVAPDQAKRREALVRVALSRRTTTGQASDPRSWRTSAPEIGSGTGGTRLGLGARVEVPASPPSRSSAFDRSRPPSSREPSPPSPPRDAAKARPIVRPFPEKYLGRYEASGAVLRSIDRAIVEGFGAAAREKIVEHLPEPYASNLRTDSIYAMVGYPLEVLDTFLELATALVVTDVNRWREFGRSAVDGELGVIVRLRPSTDLPGVIRRGGLVWGKLLGFGSWRVATAAERDSRAPAADPKTSRVGLHISELDAVSLALRLWLVGVIEQSAKRALSAEVKLVILHGELGFTTELACDISTPLQA